MRKSMLLASVVLALSAGLAAGVTWQLYRGHLPEARFLVEGAWVAEVDGLPVKADHFEISARQLAWRLALERTWCSADVLGLCEVAFPDSAGN